MKKFFKILGIIILVIVGFVLIAGLFAPKELNIERSMSMNAPKDVVFNEFSHFKTWPAWSAWLQMDPEAKLEYFGTDGEAGSGYNWDGKKVMQGTMKNAGVDGTTMNYDLEFKGMPWESKANGYLKAEDDGAGTKMTWTYHAITPYPFNAMGLFMNMEEMLGKDFSTGMTNLKKIVESMPAPLPAPTTVTDTTTATPPPVAN
jgi:Polyketide cyclase / dehydrase and lipid transport.